MVCWDILPGHLTGYYICLGHPLLLILLSCCHWTFECTPALASAKRQTCPFECVVRILGFALGVRLPVARLPVVLLEHHPNHWGCNAACTKKGDSDCEAKRLAANYKE